MRSRPVIAKKLIILFFPVFALWPFACASTSGSPDTQEVLSLARSHSELGNFQRAVEHFSAIEPELGRADRLLMAKALVEVGQLERAEAIVDGLLESEPDNTTVLELSFWIRYHNDRWNEALQLSNRLIELLPSQRLYSYNSGLVLLRLERYGDSLELLDSLSDDAASYPFYHYLRAQCFIGLERHEDAAIAYESFLQRAPRGNSAHRSALEFLLAQSEASEEGGRYRSYLEQLRSQYDEDGRYSFALALYLARVVGDNEGAITIANQAFENEDFDWDLVRAAEEEGFAPEAQLFQQRLVAALRERGD